MKPNAEIHLASPMPNAQRHKKTYNKKDRRYQLLQMASKGLYAG